MMNEEEKSAYKTLGKLFKVLSGSEEREPPDRGHGYADNRRKSIRIKVNKNVKLLKAIALVQIALVEHAGETEGH